MNIFCWFTKVNILNHLVQQFGYAMSTFFILNVCRGLPWFALKNIFKLNVEQVYLKYWEFLNHFLKCWLLLKYMKSWNMCLVPIWTRNRKEKNISYLISIHCLNLLLLSMGFALIHVTLSIVPTVPRGELRRHPLLGERCHP